MSNILKYIKSKLILKKIFNNISRKRSLKIVHHNKEIQTKIDIDINDYKDYTQIEIEIIPIPKTYGHFLNIPNDTYQSYFHIYFNDNKEEIGIFDIDENDKIDKIKVLIDYQVQNLSELFKEINCIKSIKFIQFYQRNITNMSHMFYLCSALEELNLDNFTTNKVKNMSYMFNGCTKLKKLNLSKFNTSNATDMSHMFSDCESLKELNVTNFNTENVVDMNHMFEECYLIEELDLSNFKTSKLINMSHMFQGCTALKKINLSNFNQIM